MDAQARHPRPSRRSRWPRRRRSRSLTRASPSSRWSRQRPEPSPNLASSCRSPPRLRRPERLRPAPRGSGRRRTTHRRRRSPASDIAAVPTLPPRQNPTPRAGCRCRGRTRTRRPSPCSPRGRQHERPARGPLRAVRVGASVPSFPAPGSRGSRGPVLLRRSGGDGPGRTLRRPAPRSPRQASRWSCSRPHPSCSPSPSWSRCRSDPWRP